MGSRTAAVFGAIVAGACVAAPSAWAGYLALSPEPLGNRPELAFIAADGEANHLAVSLAGDQLAVRDAGAPVFVLALGGAATRCPVGSGTSEVLCSLSVGSGGFRGASDQVSVALLDGDDTASINAGHSADLDGGAGDDMLSSAVRTALVGGPGNDRLVAGRFDDSLDGGPGRDFLDGGAGSDSISYGEARSVRVDLRRSSPQGPVGSPDVLVRIENVLGTGGRDRLIGNASRNLLIGGPGDDTLAGGPADDYLVGFMGDDRLYGGPGIDRLIGDGGLVITIGRAPRPSSDDYIYAVDGRRDQVNCGAGRDTARVDRLDRVIGCERVLVLR